MLKLNVKSEILPWIVMVIGGACFLVGSITCIILQETLLSSVPFASFFLIYFLQILIGLILLEVLLNKGKNIVKMILTSVYIGLTFYAFTIVTFPILLFASYSNSWIGELISDAFTGIILIGMSAVAGGIFTLMTLDRKKFWRNTLMCLLISIPSGILLPIVTKLYPDLISQLFIVIYGVTIGLGIGFIDGQALKSRADKLKAEVV